VRVSKEVEIEPMRMSLPVFRDNIDADCDAPQVIPQLHYFQDNDADGVRFHLPTNVRTLILTGSRTQLLSRFLRATA
jgi:hypothetical protein